MVHASAPVLGLRKRVLSPSKSFGATCHKASAKGGTISVGEPSSGEESDATSSDMAKKDHIPGVVPSVTSPGMGQAASNLCQTQEAVIGAKSVPSAPSKVSSSPWLSPTWNPRIPLSDNYFNLKTVNSLLSNAQSREKSLKILQYVAKLAAFILTNVFFGMDSSAVHLDKIAKTLSQARRCFKFFRWMKHFDDISVARSEGQRWVSSLLLFDVACNVIADISEDLCSLDRLGILPRGTLPVWAELYANYCQLVLAIVEIVVCSIRANRCQKLRLLPGDAVTLRRKCTTAYLELSKFIADIGKAFWDCELSFASELLFIVCGLWAAMVSTHKYALRALK